ncbi:MAG: pyridoxamine 5'-phosphate oxidase family protein [Mucilaginibacter sp.]
MLGQLNETEIEELLKSQYVGRIGCYSDGVTYVVPVNYIYDGNCMYSHAGEGTKIRMMRENPEVCFEVDCIETIVSWKCVIAWGSFEEITVLEEKQRVMQQLANRLMPLITSDNGHPSHGITAAASDVGDTVELVLYKIKLKTKTGRFEK